MTLELVRVQVIRSLPYVFELRRDESILDADNRSY